MLQPIQGLNAMGSGTGVVDPLAMMSPGYDAALSRLGASALSNDWMKQCLLQEARFNQQLMVLLMSLMQGSGGIPNSGQQGAGSSPGGSSTNGSGGSGAGSGASSGAGSGTPNFGPLSADDKKWLTGDTQGMDPKLAGALAEIGQRLGKKLDIRSGFRSRQEQEVLYQKYLNGTGNLAAKPGSSNHESGNAADVYIDGVALNSHPQAKAVAAELGVTFPVPGEPWHAQVA